MTDDEKRRVLGQFGSCLPEAHGSVLRAAILKTLRAFNKPLTAKEVASHAQLDYHSVASVLAKMAKDGTVRRVARGLYATNE